MNDTPDFSNLSALFLNCSIKYDKTKSHTARLINRAAGVMRTEGVDVEIAYMLDHEIAVGMEEDLSHTGRTDDWPTLQAKIEAADILVLGTPLWLGVKSSTCTLAVERMYASSGRRNDKGQFLYYGKAGGCLITGNEDGAKSAAMEILYALSHIGFTVPPAADAAWLGEAGPGPSYGAMVEGMDVPAGYDNDFTNRNSTFMAWNLMHTAKLLKEAGGIPAIGNTPEGWREVTNAADQDPEFGL